MKVIFVFTFILSSICLAQEPAVMTSVAPAKSVEQRLAELEANQTLNYFSFSGTLVSSYNDIAVKETYPVAKDHKGLDYWHLRFSLNADAEVSPQIKVYSRTTATKFFNRWREQGSDGVFNDDLDVAYGNTGSTIYLERAYVDLSPAQSAWTLSVGRLPTVHGSPTNYWDMRPRQGTYPLMNYNSPLDGAALTYRLDSQLSEGNQWALRALYTPFSDVNGGRAGANDENLSPPKSDTNAGVPTGTSLNTLIDLVALQSDYSSKNISFTDELGFILQAYQFSNLPFSSGAGTSNLSITSRAATASVEMLGIDRGNFDVSLNYTFNQTESDGFFNGPGTGFGTTKNSDTLNGHVALISLRYRKDQWATGYEWLEGSKNSLYFSSADEDLTRFYRTNGVGHHFYFTKKWMDFATVRAGFRWQQFSNLPTFIGPVVSSDREVKTLYLSLRTDF
ncbi:DUF3373 family protein [Bdellovibrio sp. HCB-162]|uniref:DUF3373 family protein n=1 Tax=Bdellovibrio sp. HCB-162 TaxID=3394234 RepID=UPI0039BCCBCD